MSYSLRVALTLTLLGCSAAFTACSSDGDDSGSGGSGGGSAGKGGSAAAGANSGGNSGAASGGKGGGASAGSAGRAGGSSAGSGGATGGSSGSSAGSGGATGGNAGTGGTSAGSGGAGGSSAGNGGTGGSTAGSGGAGGSGGAAVTYACGSDTLTKKLCSAWSAANCPYGLVCSDCVEANADYDSSAFSSCNTCVQKVESSYQCSITAYETGHLSDGVICDDQGNGADQADFSDDCFAIFSDAIDCQNYVTSGNGCPATWPLP